MKTILLSLLLFISLNTLSQELKLIDLIPSECGDTLVYGRKYINRLISQNYADSIFILNISVFTACNGISNPVFMLSGDTLKISYEEGIVLVHYKHLEMLVGDFELWEINKFSDELDCACEMELKFYIKGLEDKEYVIKINNEAIDYSDQKYKYYIPKYEVYKTDTINILDEYGLKQGYHIIFTDSLPSSAVYYEHGIPLGGRTYYEDGSLHTEEFFSGNIIIKKEYSKKGKLKSETIINK